MIDSLIFDYNPPINLDLRKYESFQDYLKKIKEGAKHAQDYTLSTDQPTSYFKQNKVTLYKKIDGSSFDPSKSFDIECLPYTLLHNGIPVAFFECHKLNSVLIIRHWLGQSAFFKRELIKSGILKILEENWANTSHIVWGCGHLPCLNDLRIHCVTNKHEVYRLANPL